MLVWKFTPTSYFGNGLLVRAMAKQNKFFLRRWLCNRNNDVDGYIDLVCIDDRDQINGARFLGFVSSRAREMTSF